MLIATWNVNSLKARMPRVEEWLETVQPDVLCLQETKLSDAQFPAMAFAGLGYETAHHGYGQWNGVAILSKVGIDDVVCGFDDDLDPDPDSRIIWATCGGVRVVSVYVPNGRTLDDDHYQYKLAWLAKLRTLQNEHSGTNNLVLLKTIMTVGHGGPTGRYDSLRETAFECAFFLDAVGLAQSSA